MDPLTATLITGLDAPVAGLDGRVIDMYTAIGSWVYRRRRLVLLGWLVLFVIGIVVGSAVFNNLKDSNGSNSSESVQGFNILDKASGMGPSVVAVVSGRPVDDPAARAAVQAASQEPAAMPGVVRVANAYETPDPSNT